MSNCLNPHSVYEKIQIHFKKKGHKMCVCVCVHVSNESIQTRKNDFLLQF